MNASSSRLDYLDAARAFALLLGVVFHASLSFMPFFVGWAVQDVSTGPFVPLFVLVSHSFRMELFFLLAGFLGRRALQRKTTGEFLRSRTARIGVPFVAGWFLLRPLLVSGWLMGAASLRGDYAFWPAVAAGFATLRTLPAGLFTGTHLWFLYYLGLVTLAAVMLRMAVRVAGESGERVLRWADAAVGWLARSRLAWPLLAVPTAAVLWFMKAWGVDTPDRSLVPSVPVLLLYGGGFGLGWLLARQADALTAFMRLTADRWILAVVAIMCSVALAGMQGRSGHPHFTAAHAGFVASYALMMWSLVGLTLGVFRRLGAQPRPWLRYVADSSYWMYLVHLPVVVWLQVAVAEVPVHWSVKLAGVTIATVGLSLLTYDLAVRSTLVGRVLNGRRRERLLWRTKPGDVEAARSRGESSPAQG